MKQGLGIDIGSTSVKMVMIRNNNLEWQDSITHEGSVTNTILELFSRYDVKPGIPTIVTGGEGRHQLKVRDLVLPLAIEETLARKRLLPQAVISIGGEDFLTYTINEQGTIESTLSSDKCASGTGEFFRQQLMRMNMDLEDIKNINKDGRWHKLSSRCSVFMKSDCTHKLNKNEATPDEIVLSLSMVMANRAKEFLNKSKINSGNVLIIGGVSQNPFVCHYLQSFFPDIQFNILPESSYFEAFGAAVMAQEDGTCLPAFDNLFLYRNDDTSRNLPFSAAEHLVDFVADRVGQISLDREYILGVDGGSTTTKVALVDFESKEIVVSFYGRTHGDPVKAVKHCLSQIKKQIDAKLGVDASRKIKISLIATTGSSREILGVFLETPGVFNEIIAHTVGTTYYNQNIDTIFEIGGQDAKYVYIKNNVPIDYAMNEACSAGTGSFIEESAAGDLNIDHAHLIADIAVQSAAPLRFGEHCSAFINSDIRKAIQTGSQREDIVGGIVYSIVSNYLNRVVGNRMIGDTIVLQGGVAKNRAVPLAFASVLKKKIIVPPSPELMGCFGVALLARQKFDEQSLTKGNYNIDSLILNEFTYGKDFQCRSCDNDCPIRTIIVNNHKYFFGGRCDKYTNIRRKRDIDIDSMENLADVYNNLLFKKYAPKPEEFIARYPENRKRPLDRPLRVGIAKNFSAHDLWPLYSWFFHELGIELVLADQNLAEGQDHIEAPYCYPAEIAHGTMTDLLKRDVDYFFVPQLKYMKSTEKDSHATLCPLVQGVPYFFRSSFPVDVNKILMPVISFKNGMDEAKKSFIAIAKHLGYSFDQGSHAFDHALEQQDLFFQKLREIGQAVIEEAKKKDETVIVMLGRNYNSLSDIANMGIPRKFISRGFRILPGIFLPIGNEEIVNNMYWYWGQLNLKSASICKKEKNLFPVYISNFSCGPDSFILHQVRWIMGSKPFLILELDSHTADAGIDTRIEAFLDIIQGYKKKMADIQDQRQPKRLKVVLDGTNTHIIDNRDGQMIKLSDNRVTLLIPSMGRYASEATTQAVDANGINSITLPVPTDRSTQLAKDMASGKECIPTLITLGSTLEWLRNNEINEKNYYLVVIPSTTGPCRTGQYGSFFDIVLDTLEYSNVTTLPLSSDNSYNELGAGVSKYIWWALAASDFLKDAHTSLQLLAKDKEQALKQFDAIWEETKPAFRQRAKQITLALQQASHKIQQIPINGHIRNLKKVLIVGEIYVRRDDFSQAELLSMLASKGIMGKITGITEWINYTTYIREMWLKQDLKRLGKFKRYISKSYRELLVLKIEKWYKAKVIHTIESIFKPTGLIPDVPHDMDMIMSRVDDFTDQEFETEATISSLTAAEAMNYGYDGVVVIAPFACLIGRLLKAIATPYMRLRGFPIITIENDGQTYSPNVRNQIEMFMLNVLRHNNANRSVDIYEQNEKPTKQLNNNNFQPVSTTAIKATKKDAKTYNENQNPQGGNGSY